MRGKLLHQERGARTLDFAGDLAVETGGHAGDPAGKDFSALRDEALEEVGVFVIDRFEVEVHAAARHRAVGFAEIGPAVRSFRLHGVLFDFAVERVALEEGVVFLLLQAVRRLRALFVACGDVPRSGFPLGFRLGAFESDVFLCHVLVFAVG